MKMKTTATAMLVLMTSTTRAQDGVIDELRSGHDAWRSHVQFYSTYQLRQGYVKDLDEAFHEEPFQEAVREATGVLHKMEIQSDELLRISIEDENVTPALDQNVPTNAAFRASGLRDEVTWRDFKLEFHHRFNDQVPRAGLFQMSENPRRNIPTAQLPISPLNPFPGFPENPLAGEAILGGDAEFDVDSASEETTIVTIRSRLVTPRETFTQIQLVEFWMVHDLPVVRRIHRRIVDGNGELFLEREARLSDFQECPGGFVARRVLFADRAARRDDVIRVTEWSSRDLGDRIPVEDDFHVTIPADVVVNGIATQQATDGEQVLYIRDLVPTF